MKARAKRAAKAAGRAAINAAKEAARDAVREEVKRLPRELRAPAGRVANSLVKGAAKIFGVGDYTIHSNSLIKGGHIAPVFTNSSHGVRVVDREYIGTIVSGALSGGSTVFQNQAYRINPSNSALFPWLSRMAEQFDQWEPHGIVFEFVSTSSEYNGTSQALGVVIVATDYDVNDPDYANRVEMENSAYAISSKASSNILHGIECSIAERPTRLLYTESSNTGSRGSLSDLGKLQVATQGMSVAGVTLGELYVTYDIEFYKKQMRQLAADLAIFDAPMRLLDTLDRYSLGMSFISGTGLFSNGAYVSGAGQLTFLNNIEYVGRTIRLLTNVVSNTATAASCPYLDVNTLVGATRIQAPSGISATFGNPGTLYVYQDVVVDSPTWGFSLVTIGADSYFSSHIELSVLE